MKPFNALADGTRREIVKILSERGELPVAEISRNFAITAPAVSQHLKVLREAGVLKVRKQAQQRFYRIDEKGMEEVGGWLTEIREKWNARLDAMEQHVKEMNNKEKK
ncbi:MAG: winged helix-turn-helix transcriptional regulator [Acidobacteriota bacterium]|nr:MAG: winged helix-turn-helix transcriptional regulator [Acidobacteriota bacterium]